MAQAEEFRFTADQIGSEILERFSGDIYGPKEIIREIVKNGYDSYFELEKYIDENQMDLELPELTVQLSVVGDDMIIQDWGLGLDKAAFEKLVSIALTDKRDVEGVSGYRGIGFWSAFTGGDLIVVESTKLDSDRLYRLHLNTKRMRALQGPRTSIAKIMNDPQCMRLESEPTKKSEHLTKVLIRAQSDDARLRPLIRNEVQMRGSLVDGCSCQLADASKSGDYVSRFYATHRVKCARLLFQGKEINKIIPSDVHDFRTHTFEVTIGGKKEVLAHAWVATNKENERIKTYPGIHILRDSFPIGTANPYSDRHLRGSDVEITRRDLLEWHVGEVHLVHEQLRPDAAGELIRDSILLSEIREQLRKFYEHLIEIAYAKQRRVTLNNEYAEYHSILKAIQDRAAVSPGEPLPEADKADVRKVLGVVERDKETVKKEKADAKIGNRAVLLREDEVKKKQRQVIKLLKDLNAESLVNPAQQNSRPVKRTRKKQPVESPSPRPEDVTASLLANGETLSKDMVLAIFDQVRDAVMDVLKNEAALQQELIAKMNEIVKRV